MKIIILFVILILKVTSDRTKHQNWKKSFLYYYQSYLNSKTRIDPVYKLDLIDNLKA